MKTYTPTIGLEIHAELKTTTKLFCNSKNDTHEVKPNINVCPVCMGHPGTLPVLNKKAVEHILRVGIAVGGKLADYTEFDRKNYFYPDIPKGYQISQYKFPLVSGGSLRGVALERVHLEEDTARSFHVRGDYSGIDFNRSGVPLMELVTKPEIHSAEDAGAFARELRLLLRTLKVSDANMERGEMRIEANISVSADEQLGTKVEVKNLNSFRAVEGAVAYEIRRQSEALERGERVIQETRGWNEARGETYAQRLKESSHDYRYFPDPDVPKLVLSEIPEFREESLRLTLPELPYERRARYGKLGLKIDDIEQLLAQEELGRVFEEVLAQVGQAEADMVLLSANYLTSDVAGILKNQPEANSARLSGEEFAALMQMVMRNEVSSRGAKDILAIVLVEGGDVRTVARDRGLLQVQDDSILEGMVQGVLDDNPAVVAEYRGGKTASLEYLVGQCMRVSKGSGNPARFREILKKHLG